MNGLLNQQTKSFSIINEFISSLSTGTLDLLWPEGKISDYSLFMASLVLFQSAVH